MADEQFHPPVNPIPPVVLALAGAIFLIELVVWAGTQGYVGGQTAVGWRVDLLDSFAFRTPILDWMIQNRTWPVEHLIRFLTYPFVHLSFTHAVFAAVLTLALGKMVGEVLGSGALLILWIAGSVAGALAFGFIVDSPRPLAGAYPPVYGLIGAYTFILWVGLTRLGEARYRAFMLIGLLVGLQLFFALLYGWSGDLIADLAGFAVGFGLSFLVSPGGWSAFLDRMRQR